MYYYFTPVILPLLFSFVLLIVVASYARSYAGEEAAPALFWALLSLALWNGAYAFEIAATTMETKLAWANIQFIAIGSAPILWLFTVLRLLELEPRRKGLLAVSLIPIPAITVALAMTSQYHQLFRGTPRLVTYGDLLLLDADYSGWHNFAFVPFQYALYLLALGFLIRSALRARPFHRRRYVWMICTALLPLLGGLLYVTGVEPFRSFNPAPLLLTLSVLFFSLLVVRQRLFDVRPVARARIVESMEQVVLVLDGRARLADFNLAAQTIFPELQDASLGQSAREFFASYPDLCALFEAEDEAPVHIALQRGEESREYRCTRSVASKRGKRDLATILMLTDETEERNLLRQMEELASVDALTGLANRRTIFHRFEVELERARRHGHAVSLIIMDLDHFKRVNDSYGHALGDDVLRATGETLRRNVRTGDVLGRYGGEEFALCLPETGPEAALLFAERLRSEIASIEVPSGEARVRLTASFGVCGLEIVREARFEELLRNADVALYEAKNRGRNRVVFCGCEFSRE